MEVTLWKSHCGSHTVEVALWKSHCESHTLKVTLWKSHCGSHTVEVTLWQCTSDSLPGVLKGLTEGTSIAFLTLQAV